MSLLTELAEVYGYDDTFDMLEDAVIDSVSPGICPRCHYTTDVEPDCEDGWCEECEANTVKSCLVIAGIM